MYALLVRTIPSNQYLGIYVLLTSFTVTLLVTPFNSVDPVNLPKLSLLVLLSFTAAGLLVSNFQFLKAKRNRVAIAISLIFLALLVLALMFDNRDFASKFYGTFGRNTGFVAYLSLTLLLLASIASASRTQLQRYVIAIVVTGGLLATYGFLQSNGKDFYQFENLYAINVFSTFGNPNFHSAFMGIASATASTLVFYSRVRKSYKTGLSILIVLYLYNISVSSQQGYFNFAGGIAAATIIFLFKSQKLILGWVALTISTAGGFLILLGLFNSGPMAQFIYKGSLQARGFYWQAATTMILEHPFFGVGMDGYGDAYLRARTSQIASVNFGISSDSAHSIPLDIGSNGGSLLLISYLAINALVLVSIFRILKRTSEFDVVFTAIVAAWVAYQAQSLISINQLGLGVWGWSLSGLIIGYEISSRRESPGLTYKAIPSIKATKEKISSFAIVLTFLTTSAGIGTALPPIIAANKFYKALQTGDPEIIQDSAYLKPNERMRYLYVARALQENKFESEAISVLRDAAKIYPDSIDLWRRWASIPSATPAEIARANAEIKRLDPFNPNL
jgi:O-antigen ligase